MRAGWLLVGVVAGCVAAPGVSRRRVAPRAAQKPAPPIAPDPMEPLPAVSTAQFSESPPFRLPHTFEPTRYRARIALGVHRFTGHIEIEGTAREDIALLWLHGVDLVVTHAIAHGDAGDVPLAYSAPRDDQTLGFRPKTPLTAGQWVIAIDYTGPIRDSDPPPRSPSWVDAPLALGLFRRVIDGATYVFTQSEAIYARRIFPCVDEPDRKVPWQLTLDVNHGLVAASNTPIATTTPLDRDHERITFEPTLPLPSYLVAFAVGPFDVVEAAPSASGIQIRVLAQHGQGGKLAEAARVAPKILDLLESWLGVKYAYGKLDLVSVPDAGWGAMENPGLVTFNKRYLELDPTSIVAHELTHQWFGDLVTCAWWDDIWLNESFAQFFADEIVRELDPAAPPHDLADERLEGLRMSSFSSTHHEIMSNHDLEFVAFAPFHELLTGAARLRLVEAYLGTDAFRRALRQYLEAHAHGTVTTDDLIASLASATRASLKPVLDGLISRSTPVLGFELVCDGNPHVEVTRMTFEMPVCVAYDQDGKRAEACMTVSPQASSIRLSAHRCPQWMLPDAGARGPYWIDWSARLVTTILQHAWPSMTHAEQRALFDELSDPELKLQVFTRLAPTLPPGELSGEADYVATLADWIEPDLRPRFDRWVRDRFGSLARVADLTPEALDDSPHAQAADSAARLVAMTAEPELAARARTLATRYQTGRANYRLSAPILALAAATDPKLLDELLASLATLKQPARWSTIEALSQVPGLLHALTHDPSPLRYVDPYELHRLFAHVCSEADRDAAAALITDQPSRGFSPVLPRIDACIAERKRLAPLLHTWLGST